jgi:NADPH-dependent curcumin reductase CurA
MQKNNSINRRIVLAEHSQGMPTLTNFRLEEAPIPTPQDGQVLLRTEWLSLDPYMRNLMEKVGPGYADPVPLGATMVGGTINRIIESRHPGFRSGDVVIGSAGWQDYALSDGSDLMPVNDLARPSLALGALGMPGFTAYVGLLDIGEPKPGETVVVAAATGAVGSVVGQIAKIKGARVVGIAGGPDKCRYAVEELGFDACLDHRDPRLAQHLAEVCPDGIDVYFENVGGAVFDAVHPLLNAYARVPVCGFIAHYNGQTTNSPDRLPKWMATLLSKRIRMQGFIILDHYATRFEAFQHDMSEWIAAGKVKVREHIVDGLENAPEAFIGLQEGKNFGKLVVRVSGN